MRAFGAATRPGAALLALALGACASPPPPEPAAAETIRIDACGPAALAALPGAGPAPEVSRPAPTAFALANGLRVWVAPRPGAVAAARLLVARGRRDAPDVAELAARVLAQGGDAFGPRDLADLGAAIAFEVGETDTALDLSVPPAELPRALALLAAATERPVPDAATLDAVRRRQRLATLAGAAAPATVARRVFHRETLGADHPEARPHPSKQALAAVSPADLEAFLAKALRPERMRVLVAGDVDPEAVRARVEALFGAPDAGDARADTAAVTPPRATSGRDAPPVLHLVHRPGSAQAEIVAGYATVDRPHPDHAGLSMLASLLGGGVGGRLFRDLRERQGLAYIVAAEQTDAGAFLVTTQARHERVPALLQGIVAHLAALSEVPLADCEVEMLRTRMEGELAFAGETAAAAVEAETLRLRHELPPDAEARRRAAYREARSDTLLHAARAWLAGPPAIVVVGDADRLEDVLAARLPRHEIRRVAP